MANTENIRQIVMEMLLEMNTTSSYSHILVRDVQNKYDYLTVQEKAFLKRLFEGTLERMIEIDYVINQFSKIKVNKMKPVIRTILRLSTYQILYMDSVPDSAACNEAVKLAQLKKFGTLKGFVNGVLRNIVRNKNAISYPDRQSNLLQYLSVTYSMPEWIIRLWLSQYDEETVEAILKGLLQEHPVTIRIMDTKQSDRILEKIQAVGITPIQHTCFSNAYVLDGNLESVSTLPGFADGTITVQDVSSMLSVACAGIKEGDRVIDVCAAPGGKTMLASQYAGEQGRILSRDVSDKKVDMIRENVERCGLNNVDCQVWDARESDESMIASADVVIADLPCSGLGVMGKKRDIKYHVSEASLKEITILQQDILKTIVSYVKPDGILLYSTCTINADENERMVTWLVENYDFELESIEPYLPDELKTIQSVSKGYLQLLPGIQNTDGFFMARLRRKKS